MVRKAKTKKQNSNDEQHRKLICSLPKTTEPDLSHINDDHRVRLISVLTKVWVNATELTYYFFNSPARRRGGVEQEQAVRDAFDEWKQLGIGLSFREVDNPEDAIIRIGFDQFDGSWSYVGRDSIKFAKDPNVSTMNFGWDLTTDYGHDTALHEIGHALGFPHEHQNPRAGIVWNEEKVYANLSAPPNNWDSETIRFNIIRKIPANTVGGSDWDKNSIMHYQFDAGLIDKPEEYRTKDLIPESGLSQRDIETVKKFYPVLQSRIPQLRAFESQRFTIDAGEQVNYIIKPTISRDYTLQTFGKMDTVMVLLETIDDREEFIAGDDDSGTDYNAKIEVRLHRNRKYVVRTRLYYAEAHGSGSIMVY
jgi:hypothetical protein